MTNMTDVRVNYALIVRGNLFDLIEFIKELDSILAYNPEIKLVHQQTSASRLWIKEGEDANEPGKTN